MPPGLGIIVAVLMALAVQLIRLRLPVPDAGRRARSLAWRPRMRQRDTMNYFTAHHLEVAGALARPGDGSAPPAVTRPQAGDGQGRHPIRLAGIGQVTASRAEMIAAAPGRARQQLTPALTGVG